MAETVIVTVGAYKFVKVPTFFQFQPWANSHSECLFSWLHLANILGFVINAAVLFSDIQFFPPFLIRVHVYKIWPEMIQPFNIHVEFAYLDLIYFRVLFLGYNTLLQVSLSLYKTLCKIISRDCHRLPDVLNFTHSSARPFFKTVSQVLIRHDHQLRCLLLFLVRCLKFPFKRRFQFWKIQ